MNLKNAEFIDIDIPVDWQLIIDDLTNLNLPVIRPYTDLEGWTKHLEEELVNIAPESLEWEKKHLDYYTDLFSRMTESGMEFSNVQLYNYFPNDHYSPDKVEKLFCEMLNLNCVRAWFSRVDPGCWVPWHWDIEASPYDDSTAERYSVFIGGPKLGHVFILGKEIEKTDYFCGIEHGRIIKWKDRNEWHAGGNLGFKPKWMYHFLGNR